MTPVPIWFERKFAFTFPLEQYPNVCIRLRGTPARLEELLRGCPSQVRLARPEGKWSVQEHAGHLLDLESLWMARVEDFHNSADVLTAADLTNRKTDDADHNSRPLDEILAAFRQARFELLNRLDAFPPALLAGSILHPRLKQPMRLVDHLFFAAEHDDHHLARIFELIRGAEP